MQARKLTCSAGGSVLLPYHQYHGRGKSNSGESLEHVTDLHTMELWERFLHHREERKRCCTFLNMVLDSLLQRHDGSVDTRRFAALRWVLAEELQDDIVPADPRIMPAVLRILVKDMAEYGHVRRRTLQNLRGVFTNGSWKRMLRSHHKGRQPVARQQADPVRGTPNSDRVRRDAAAPHSSQQQGAALHGRRGGFGKWLQGAGNRCKAAWQHCRQQLCGNIAPLSGVQEATDVDAMMESLWSQQLV